MGMLTQALYCFVSYIGKDLCPAAAGQVPGFTACGRSAWSDTGDGKQRESASIL